MSREALDNTVVDLYNLHIEWRDQPRLKKEALDDDAELKDEVTRKKSYIKYRTSQIALEYNTGKRTIVDKEDKVIVKPTVGALKSAVESNEELYKLEQELNDLLRKLDLSTNYSSAISDKKYALQDEVKLYLAEYFSEPMDYSRKGGDYIREIEEVKVKMDASEAREELKERRRKRLKKDE